MSALKLEDLLVKPGEPVARAFARLKQWAQGFELIKGDPRIRFRQEGGRGTWVSADIDQEGWTPHFFVSVSGKTASVGLGRVNNELPRLNDVPLDGVIAKGKTIPVPPLKLSGPGEDGRSWVCVRAKVADSGLLDPQDREALTIVHAATLQPPAGSTPFIGLQPLALLEWSEDGKTATPHQIVMHHLQHKFVPADLQLGRVSRHFFWAV